MQHCSVRRKRERSSRDVTSQQLITVTSEPAGVRDGISVAQGELEAVRMCEMRIQSEAKGWESMSTEWNLGVKGGWPMVNWLSGGIIM